MPWPRFLVANAVGAILWATVVAVAAYTLGRGIHAIRGPLGLITMILAAAAIVAIFLYLRRNEAAMQAAAEKALPGPVA
jgi:membrane protein DedA with SNARE-associated domain